MIAIPVTAKLFVFPLLGIAVLSFLNISQDVEQVLLIEVAMPSITTASVILALYNADEDYGVMQTLFTNLFALVSIPFIVIIGSIILR